MAGAVRQYREGMSQVYTMCACVSALYLKTSMDLLVSFPDWSHSQVSSLHTASCAIIYYILCMLHVQ